MTPREVLLDTDTVSLLARNNQVVLSRAIERRAAVGNFAISAITRYEVLKGLAARNAARQMLVFEAFCADNEMIPVTGEVAVRAAGIHVALRARGEPMGDLDVLIAATALVNGLVIVTSNTRHFARIDGVEFENWMEAR